MRRVSYLCVLAGLLAGLLTGCAHTTSTPMSAAERLSLYQRHAGAPVAMLRLDRPVQRGDWTPLGDQALALWTSAGRGHLLEFRNRCSGLSTAQRIGITNSGGLVAARFDSVVIRTPAGISPMGAGCRISTIRPLDGRALRDEKREIREAQFSDRPADVQPEPEVAPAGGDTP